MATRPRYLLLSETCAGSNGDPLHHYYVNALTSGGLAAWADNIISRMEALAADGNLPDGIVIHNPGGLNGFFQQIEGVPYDPHPTLGSAAMTAALEAIRNACIALGMRLGLIIYTGPGVLGGDHATVFAPINIGVPIIVDGAGQASEALLAEYDAAAGQTVGIESMSSLTQDASNRARLSETICGRAPNAPWDPDAYAGGPTGSVRPDSFGTLDTFTGQLISIDTWASATEDVRRRALQCWQLGMSVESPIFNWESGALTVSMFRTIVPLVFGNKILHVRRDPINSVNVAGLEGGGGLSP